MASIGVTNITADTLTFYIDGLDTNYATADRWVQWTYFINGLSYTYSPQGNLPAKISNTLMLPDFNLALIALDPNTTYQVQAQVNYNGGNVLLFGAGTTLPLSASRPPLFQWYSVIATNEPFKITANEWCALLDNINAVRVYKGLSPYNFSRPTSGMIFTAMHYNQCVYAIDDMLSTDLSKIVVNSGDKILATGIDALRQLINLVK